MIHEPDQVEAGTCVAVCTYRRPGSVLRLLESIAAQDCQPRQVIIVDASPNDDTERALIGWAARGGLPHCMLYFRVSEGLRGLTRQRNFALARVATDLVAFFDDDIVLLPGCLREMERVHRDREHVVGVGALIVNENTRPRPIWLLRRLLYVVPSLRPGKYFASGVSTPWWSAGPLTKGASEGDWLPGGATMWRTAAARETGFIDGFAGYGSGEDLEFSQRVRLRGKLVLAGAAQVEHLHDPGGRPNMAELGYMIVRNHHRIHQETWSRRSRAASLYFAYATVVEALLQSVNLLRPTRVRETWRYLRGVSRYGLECMKWRHGPPTA